MISIRFFLDTRKQTKDDTYQLSIVLQRNNKTATIPSGIRLKKGQFDNKTQQVLSSCQGYKQLNQMLSLKISSLSIEISKLTVSGWIEGKSMSEIKSKLTGEYESKPVLFDYYANVFIEGLDNYRTRKLCFFAVKKMKKYCENYDSLTFTEMNLPFFSDLVNKMSKTLSPDTIIVYIGYYKAIFNYAINSNVIPRECYPFKNLRLPKPKERHLVIPLDIIRKVRDYNDRKKLIKYADIFMLSFYLAGINAIDLLTLPQIEGKKLCYYRRKTGVYSEIDIPNEAMQIIDKYRGKEKMLNFCEGKSEKQITYFINEITKVLKRLKDRDKNIIFSKLSLYYARHTWSTIAHDLDIPDAIIDMALSHKSPYTMSEHYIIRNRKKVGEANKKVIDVLNADKKKAED